MQKASAAVYNKRLEQKTNHDLELMKEIEILKGEVKQLNIMNEMHDSSVSEYPPHEFPYPFLAKAVELEGMWDGVEYMIQGLGVMDTGRNCLDNDTRGMKLDYINSKMKLNTKCIGWYVSVTNLWRIQILNCINHQMILSISEKQFLR